MNAKVEDLRDGTSLVGANVGDSSEGLDSVHSGRALQLDPTDHSVKHVLTF